MSWCNDHPTVAAVGVCPQCSKAWCQPCSTRGNISKALCPKCGALLGAPPAGGPGDIFARLFSSESIIMAVSLAVLGLVLGFLGGVLGFGLVFQLIYAGAIAAYYFNIIQHVGAGAAGMPGPSELAGDLGTVFSRGFRGIVCILVGFAPLLIYIFALHHGREVFAERTLFLELLVAGQLYMPAVLLAVTFGDNGLNALWPPAWIQIIARAPGPYASFTMLWLITVFIGGAIIAVLQSLVIEIPYAGIMIASIISMMFWWFQAILVGRFIRQNGDAFGWTS